MENGSAIGTGLTEVLEALHRNGTAIRLNQLEKEVAQLCDDGVLYTTIDEEHHKPTGSEGS